MSNHGQDTQRSHDRTIGNHHDKVKKLKFDVFVVGDDWVGKYDYLEKLGVTVVYTPYGRGVSSSALKKRIAKNYERLKRKSESHIPDDVVVSHRMKKGKR